MKVLAINIDHVLSFVSFKIWSSGLLSTSYCVSMILPMHSGVDELWLASIFKISSLANQPL
jgi:hypothetical protein